MGFTAQDYLMHHGIKGQKWGVRRFQNSDGTYTDAGAKRRAKYLTSEGGLTKKGVRKFRKEYKKLQKLQDRADINKQREASNKYNRRSSKAALLALGAAGTAGAASGFKNSLKSKRDSILSEGVKQAARLDQDRAVGYTTASMATKMKNEQDAANWWREGLTKYVEAGSQKRKNYESAMVDINNLNKIDAVRKGTAMVATATAAVSAGAAIYNKVQAHAAKKRTTELGHEKAVQDVKRQIERMNEMFWDVKLSDLQKKKAS